jgi:YbgC/YbaW family acyl-CoA thioester hydrolase
MFSNRHIEPGVNNMPYEFRYSRRVEFSDTDLAGIVHFSNYFKYMEAAEHAFCLSLGFSVHAMHQGQLLTWPRVQVQCEYLRPLHFEDLVEVHLLVLEKGRKSVRYGFIFSTERKGEMTKAALGTMKVVCVTRDAETGLFRSIPIPEDISNRFETAPQEMIELFTKR